MEHSFDIDIAKEYGVNCAILLRSIWFWTEKNRANGRHEHDGKFWSYNSVKAFEELFPYMSAKAIRTALQKLEDEGLIETGQFNEKAYDRTKWYCITPKGQMHLSKMANGISQKGKPIPDNIPDNIERDGIDNTITTNKNYSNRFIPPTIDEVKEYCIEKKLLYVNPDAFIEFYSSKGWMVGKNKMTNWKMSISGWNRRAMERGDKPYKPKTGTSYRQKPKPEPEDDGRIPLEEYLKINPNI